MTGRYANLEKAVMETVSASSRDRPYIFVEIGVWNGQHARELLHLARKAGSHSTLYFGFDLFEDMTPEVAVQERSKTKPSFSMSEVSRVFQDVPASVFLYKGRTSETLPPFVEDFQSQYGWANLIFIDGGHSLETIDNDWKWMSKIMDKNTVCILDDYYPDRTDVGCQKLVYSLGPEFHAELLDPVDYFPHTKTLVRMVKVTRR